MTNIEDLERALVLADRAGNVEDAKKLANAIVTLRASQYQPTNPTDEMGTGQRMLAGVGKAFTDIGRSAGQMIGTVSPQDVAESRKYDQPLMDTGAGMAGSIAGNVAAAAPAMLIPGVNSVAGAGAMGGVLGALQPTTADESRLKNTAVGAALGAGSQWGLGKLAGIAQSRLASAEAEAAANAAKNAARDQGVAAAQELGYKTIPSVSGGGLTGRIVEGATGTAKAKQLAAVRNQELTNTLAKKAFGLAEDAPLNRETLAAVRADAAQAGYAPARQIPRIEADQTFRNEVGALTSRADNAAKDFGALVESDVTPLVERLQGIKSFSGDSAVDAISIFREKSSELYAQGNRTLGSAYRKASEAIESQLERGMAKNGGAELIKDFRAARTKIAQTFDAEKALREGQGNIDALALKKIFAKNPGRMTGELSQIAKAASAMPDVMGVPKAGWANPVTALDSGGGVFASILSGNPMPLAYGPARAAARYGLLSNAGQKAFTGPSYGPSMAQRLTPAMLEELKRRGAGGLLGYAAQ